MSKKTPLDPTFEKIKMAFKLIDIAGIAVGNIKDWVSEGKYKDSEQDLKMRDAFLEEANNQVPVVFPDHASIKAFYEQVSPDYVGKYNESLDTAVNTNEVILARYANLAGISLTLAQIAYNNDFNKSLTYVIIHHALAKALTTLNSLTARELGRYDMQLCRMQILKDPKGGVWVMIPYTKVNYSNPDTLLTDFSVGNDYLIL